MTSLILLFFNYFVIGFLLSFCCSEPERILLLLVILLSIVPFYYKKGTWVVFAIYLLLIFLRLLGLINVFNGLNDNDIWTFFVNLVVAIVLGWVFLSIYWRFWNNKEKEIRELQRIYKVAKDIYDQAQKQLKTAEKFSEKAQKQITTSQQFLDKAQKLFKKAEQKWCSNLPDLLAFITFSEKAQKQITTAQNRLSTAQKSFKQAQSQLNKAQNSFQEAENSLPKAKQDLEEKERKLRTKYPFNIENKLIIFIPLVIGLSLFPSYLDQLNFYITKDWLFSILIFVIGFLLSGILALFSSTLLDNLQAVPFLSNKNNWSYKFLASFFSEPKIPGSFVKFTNFGLVLLVIYVGISGGSTFYSDENSIFNKLFTVQQTFLPQDLLKPYRDDEKKNLTEQNIKNMLLIFPTEKELKRKLESTFLPLSP